MIKKLKYYLQKFDGVWSVPLAFAAFLAFGNLLEALFNYSGTYDPGFLQPLFLAGAVVIGATNIAVLGLHFTFRGLHQYLYGEIDSKGERVNYSKEDWLKLSVALRYGFAFGVFAFFVATIIIVYLKLV